MSQGVYDTLLNNVYFGDHNDPGLLKHEEHNCAHSHAMKGGKVVGGRQLLLIVSLMQQIMNQKRQSLKEANDDTTLKSAEVQRARL